MKQSHWLLCVASVASPGMKTYSESRIIELRNLQILKKNFAFTPQSKTRHGYEAWARRSARPKISVY